MGFVLSLVVSPSVGGGEVGILAWLYFSDGSTGALLRRWAVPVIGVVLRVRK